jgi:hypothetical protein
MRLISKKVTATSTEAMLLPLAQQIYFSSGTFVFTQLNYQYSSELTRGNQPAVTPPVINNLPFGKSVAV